MACKNNKKRRGFSMQHTVCSLQNWFVVKMNHDYLWTLTRSFISLGRWSSCMFNCKTSQSRTLEYDSNSRTSGTTQLHPTYICDTTYTKTGQNYMAGSFWLQWNPCDTILLHYGVSSCFLQFYPILKSDILLNPLLSWFRLNHLFESEK